MIVWISGASSGLGYYVAKELALKGHTVIAGARSFENKKEHLFSSSITLDVTSDERVESFVKEALLLGAPSMLINAAGIFKYGAVEDISLDETRQIFEVNLFGALRLTKLFMKHRDKEKQGLIVNFSSINGLFSTPFQGAYSMSKHAVEAMSEAMQLELQKENVKLMVVEPGDHRGGSAKNRVFSKFVSEKYKAYLTAASEKMISDENNGSIPEVFARKLVKNIQKKHPPFRLRIAKWDQLLAVILHDILPNRLFFNILGGYYKKKGE